MLCHLPCVIWTPKWETATGWGCVWIRVPRSHLQSCFPRRVWRASSWERLGRRDSLGRARISEKHANLSFHLKAGTQTQRTEKKCQMERVSLKTTQLKTGDECIELTKNARRRHDLFAHCLIQFFGRLLQKQKEKKLLLDVRCNYANSVVKSLTVTVCSGHGLFLLCNSRGKAGTRRKSPASCNITTRSWDI